MADTSKILQKIRDKERQLEPLYQQMDEDFDLFNLKPYRLLDYDGNPVKRVDNVTLNAPRVFALRLMSVISSAELGINIVEHNLEDKDVTKIKTIFYSALKSADKFLKLKRLGKLRNNLVRIAALRGNVGVRAYLWEDEEGNVIWDYLPMDTRFCSWEIGKHGLLWYSYKLAKSKDTILAEYGKQISSPFADVREYWDEEQFIIFVENQPVVVKENPLKRCPAAVIPVGEALAIRTDNPLEQIKLEGESIYSSVRSTYPNLNKAASILMTTAAFGFRPPIQRVVPPNVEIGEEIDPEARQLYTGGATIIDAGHSRFEPMPLKDISQSLPTLYGILSAEKQQATFPDIEFGDIRYPLSAIAIAKLTEGRNQVFQPVVEAVQDCYNFIFEMTKEQLAMGLVNPKNMDISVMKKEFSVETELHVISPEENISRYTVAAAARGFLDSDTIRTQILKIKDEGKVQRNLDRDFTEAIVPELRAYREAKRLLGEEPDPETEAKLILMRLKIATGVPPAGQGQPTAPPLEGTMEGSYSASQRLANMLGIQGVGIPPSEEGEI